MKHCILCNSKISAIEKPEHILLDALGGRKTTRHTLCSACNNTMGAGPDRDLAESIGPLRTIANLKSGSRRSAPPLTVSPQSGASYVLNPDRAPTPKIKKSIDIGEDAAGNKTLSINARDREHFELLLDHAASALGLPDEKREVFKTKARVGATVKSNPAGEFDGQLVLGSGRSQESMAKACLVLWTELVGNAEVCSAKYDEIRAFIRDSITPNSCSFTFGIDTRQMPKLQDRFGDNANLIWVGSNNEGEVRGYFRLLGAVGWTFTLCENSAPNNMSIALISNPMDQSQWVCGVEHGDVLNFDWVGECPNYQDTDWSAPSAKLQLIMAHGHENMLSQSTEHIVENTLREFGVVDVETETDIDVEAFAKRLAEKVAHLAMKKPFEEPLMGILNHPKKSDK